LPKGEETRFCIFFSFDIFTLSHQGPVAILLLTITGGEKEEGNTCELIYQERKQVSIIQGVIVFVASSSSLLQDKFLNS